MAKAINITTKLTALLVASAVLIVIASNTWRRHVTFDAAIEARNNALRMERQQQRADVMNLALSIVVVGGAVVLVGGAVAFCGALLYRLHAKSRDERLRARNGLFPLVEVRQHGQTHIVDPNSLVGSALSVNGSIKESEPVAGWDAQLAATEQANKVRLMSAYGDNGQPGGRGMNAQSMKMLTGEADARAERERRRAEYEQLRIEKMQNSMLPEPEDEPIEFEELTIEEAWGKSSPDRWVLGQSMDTGELATFNPRTTVHMAILGATGSGKTESSGLHAMIYARVFGMHTIILDGKGGLDWGKFSHICEWHEMSHATLSAQVSQLLDIHNERMGILKQFGAANIYDLNTSEVQPMFVILEEFGNAYAMLKQQSRNAASRVDIGLDTLLRLARATGISLCFIDQAPQNWTQQMRGNTKFKMAYKLGGQMGNMVGEYYLHNLPDVGWFSLDNEFYRAWHTAAGIEGKTIDLPRTQYTVLDTVTPVLSGGGDMEQITANPTLQKTPVQSEKSGAGVVLTGAPSTGDEIAYIRSIYERTGSKNKTLQIVWGGKNSQRMQWLNEALGV